MWFGLKGYMKLILPPTFLNSIYGWYGLASTELALYDFAPELLFPDHAQAKLICISCN